MAFTYDPNLPDTISRTRRLLLDTDEENALLTDEAILNYHRDYGVNEGTAKLALMLLNEYGSQPTTATVEGMNIVWGDRMKAWQQVISDVRVYGFDPDAPPAAPNTVQRRRIVSSDPYALRRRRHGW